MLEFYYVDENYINFLQTIESKIPNINYTKYGNNQKNKFVCGTVLSINGHNYYAPLSHNIKTFFSSFLIYGTTSQAPKSSLRLCYMFPVIQSVVTKLILADLAKDDIKYANLVSMELNYCQQNQTDIITLAQKVYNIANNKMNRLSQYCCDFKLLEENYKKYTPQVIYPVKQ